MDCHSLTVYLFKNFPSGEILPVENPAEKKYYSARGKPLSEAGIKKALDLHATFKEKGSFACIYSAPSQTAIGTALLASTGRRENLEDRVMRAFESAEEIAVEKDWRQVELGSFEGVEAGKIQEAYASTHPEATYIPEPNDCLNYPWDNQEEYKFEPYKTNFETRIRQMLTKMAASFKKEETVAVFAPTESLRTVMLISEPSEELKTTAFYEQAANCAKQNSRAVQAGLTFEQLINRFNLKPSDGSWIKIRLEAGKILLCEVSEGVGFREKAPVPGFTK